MANKPKMTTNVQLVLAAFLADLDTDQFGTEITARTGIGSGGLYLLLKRLEEADWLVGHWEDADYAASKGRPPRRYYRLTGEGEAVARARLSDRRGQILVQSLLGTTATDAPGSRS